LTDEKGVFMKIAALISLFSIIAAAATAIVLLTVRMLKAGKTDKRSVGMIVLFVFLIAVMLVNLFVVVPLFG
jgi:hypothetical protein